MKKFLLSMLLILMGAMWSSVDARWNVGAQKGADEIHVGDTIVLEFCPPAFQSMYLAGSKLSAAGIVTEDNIYIVEEGPQDIRTGAPTVYLKRLETAGRGEGQDGYLKYNGGWATITYDLDPANAANLQIISCEEDIPWSTTYSYYAYDSEDNVKYENDVKLFRSRLDPNVWYKDSEQTPNWRNYSGERISNSKSVGFSLSTDEESFTYLGSWSSSENIWFWQYTDTNQWNVYEVSYEKSLADDLQTLIDMYLEEGEYISGPDPGFYDETVVNAYTEALQAALTVVITGTSEEEFTQAIADLKAAHAALAESRVPLTEGYYYFVSAFEDYINNFGVEKAAYVNLSSMQLYYKNFNPDNVDFVFEVTKAEAENEYWVQHLATGVYVGLPSNWYASTPPVTYDKEEPQWIKYYDAGASTGKWFWGSSKQHSTSYTPSTGTASDNEGALTSWGQWGDQGIVEKQFNCWYLRKITDQAVIDGFEEQRAQAQRTQTLTELVSEASDLYGKLFVYTTDDSEGLIKVVGGGANEDVDVNSQIRFSNIRVQGVAFADKYEYLIDDNDTTYMQGSGYIELNISNTPADMVTFEYNTRDGGKHGSNPNWNVWGANERPNKAEIYVTNDTADVDSWALVGTVEMGALALPARATVNLGGEYGFIRFNVINNANGGNYFTISEFQLYKAGVNEAESQYYTTEGMSAAADAMTALLPEMRELISANSVSDEDIAKMRAALEAVKELYADADALSELIASCETIIAGTRIGDGMGELSDESFVTALQSAIDQGKAAVSATPVTVAEVKAAESALIEAKAAFLAAIKSFEEGKWYFITNLDNSRTGEAGAENSFCGGSAIYLKDKYAGSSVTKWGLFDEGNMSLNADNNPKAMWRFVPVEGTDGYYAIQNMYSGYYLGDYAGDEINMPVSEEPVPYEIAYSGNAEFILYPRGGKNRKNYALWPEGAANDVVCHEANPGTASAWTFVEIDPEEQQAITIADFAMNVIDVMAVPYDINDLAGIQDDVHTYAIKSMSQETIEPTDGENDEPIVVTHIELYEKSNFKAGEPCIIALGNWEDESAEAEPYDLVIPFPTEIVDHTAPLISNGIVGGLHGFECAAGTAVSNGKRFNAATGTYKFDAQTGIIDIAYYDGEVEGVTTAITLTIEGMDWTRTGVNGAITVEDIVNALRKGAYTIDGQKVAAPQKGQIYIIDGKKVKY